MSKKGTPVSVSIIRPQSNSSRSQKEQKPLRPIKATASPNKAICINHKQIVDTSPVQSNANDETQQKTKIGSKTKADSPQNPISDNIQKVKKSETPQKSRIPTRSPNVQKLSQENKTETQSKSKLNSEIPSKVSTKADVKKEAQSKINSEIPEKTQTKAETPSKTQTKAGIPSKISAKAEIPSKISTKTEVKKETQSKSSTKTDTISPQKDISLYQVHSPPQKSNNSPSLKTNNSKNPAKTEIPDEYKMIFDDLSHLEDEYDEGIDEYEEYLDRILDNLKGQTGKTFLTNNENENEIQNENENNENENGFSEKNFEVYHQLTTKLFDFIEYINDNDNEFSTTLFKALAIGVHVCSVSDKTLLTSSLLMLQKMSKIDEYKPLFVDCNLLEPILKICFLDIFENMANNKKMAYCASSILVNILPDQQVFYGLLHLDTLSMICKVISFRNRKVTAINDANYSIYLANVLEILSVLCEKTSDFSKYAKYSLPTNLLFVLKIFRTDTIIQNKVSLIFRTILDFDENVEELECEDLTPLFDLLESNDQKVIENTVFAISNAIQISDFFVDTIIEIDPPSGIPLFCNKLKKNDTSNNNFTINIEILRSLVKLTSFRQGAELAIQSFNKIAQFLDIDMDTTVFMSGNENGVSQRTQISYSLSIIKNLAYISPDRVAMVVKGKMRFLAEITAGNTIGELAKVLMKTENGKKVCEEVKDLPQISSLF